jgi:hypothetical protein
MSAQNTASDHVLLSDKHTEAQISMPAHNLTLRCGWPVSLWKTHPAFRLTDSLIQSNIITVKIRTHRSIKEASSICREEI